MRGVVLFLFGAASLRWVSDFVAPPNASVHAYLRGTDVLPAGVPSEGSGLAVDLLAQELQAQWIKGTDPWFARGTYFVAEKFPNSVLVNFALDTLDNFTPKDMDNMIQDGQKHLWLHSRPRIQWMVIHSVRGIFKRLPPKRQAQLVRYVFQHMPETNAAAMLRALPKNSAKKAKRLADRAAQVIQRLLGSYILRLTNACGGDLADLAFQQCMDTAFGESSRRIRI